jgi:hypothetical protein
MTRRKPVPPAAPPSGGSNPPRGILELERFSLIRAAGFEAILYRSTKGSKRCLAVFPDALTSGSFVELADPAPSAVRHTRLDVESADELSG